ncbi:MAG TPA: DUF1003 domain-containing protein [Enhygromyxa sp.]|nr:DUF1003 domain-containing protein [Enhygromyxa sp.]
MSSSAPSSAPEPPLSKLAQENIRTVAALEREAARRRTSSERVSDSMIRVMGSLGFVIVHVVIFAAWFLINSSLIPALSPFDPFPFGILTLVVSTEGVLLAIFVLINQNRMSREADHRAHLDLQISLLAEAEATKTLSLLQGLARFLGHDLRPDEQDIEVLVEPTNLPELAQGLRDNLEHKFGDPDEP